VWLIKGFFDAVPRSLDEAATMDGAGHATIFFRIILPLITPILAVSGLLAFVGVIGEFLLASIFLRDTNVKTLAVGLFGIIDADRSNNLGLFAAGSLLTALPVVLLFQYLQRYIVGGLTAGGVKG
jgi:arabinogalactan oligomer/maltooligosaccharide transport system permease protein